MHAQEAAASLEVTVVSGESQQPIANAQILTEGGKGGLTDANGVLRLSGLPPGTATVRVQFLGYATRSIPVALDAGRTTYLSIPLETQAIVLPGVRTEVRRPEPAVRSRELREFYSRIRTGTGQYITRADINEQRPRDLSELFRMLPGLVLINNPMGDKPMMEAKMSANIDRNGRARECPIQYFIDGTPFKPTTEGVIGHDIPLKDIEGIEIYRRGTGVPAKFHRLGNRCGVILIWKKERI